MKRKMRYLSERANGDYRYVRDYPTKLLKTFPNHPKQFSRELGSEQSMQRRRTPQSYGGV